MKVKLTPSFVAKPTLPESPKDRTIHWDGAMPGFGLMVTANGHASFVCQYRTGRRSHRMSLKPGLTLQDARQEAKKLLGDVARGGDPLVERQKAARAGDDTFQSIAEAYIKREGKSVRSMGQRRAVLERVVYPRLGARPVGEIKRSDIVRLLDKIDDERGPVAADQTLAFMRRIMSWHASRSDDFRSPIVRGMAHTKPRERARQRILTDDELRAVWSAAEASAGLFGPFVQFLLLTACRRTEAAAMASSEVDGAVWTIPPARYKTGLEMVLPLSPLALAALARPPKIGEARFVFSGDGERPFSGYSKAKAQFDKAVTAVLRKQDPEAKALANWTLHDLRRTARSLMSRAGVDANVAERCLGHVISGVRGTYDRHAYFDEKKHAFEALAALVERILNPPAENVIAIDTARK
jgi:integrase